MCAVSMHNRARIPKKVPVSHTEHLCVHMNTFYRKIDYIQSFFPEHFNTEENDDDNEDPTPGVFQMEEINLEDLVEIFIQYISTDVPFGCHELLLSTCDDIESNIPVHGKLEE